jgi:hypothetical protein
VHTSHHGRSLLARLAFAAGGVVAFVAVCEAAWMVSVLAGPGGVIAGAAVIVAVFTACWYVFRVRPMLRAARPARNCEPVTQAVLADSEAPAQLAA